MKFSKLIMALGVSSLSVPAAMAEPASVHRETPGGHELKVEVGENIWRSRDFEGTPGIVTNGPVDVPWDEDDSIYIPANSEMVIIRNHSLKVCQKQTSTHLQYRVIGVDIKGWDTCLIDKDEDGLFDLVTRRKLGGSRKVEPQIGYTRQLVPFQGDGAWARRKTLTYTGTTRESILLSYREFSNNYLTPNFTDDLTIPRPASFPADYFIKGRMLTILSLDNTGMRYRLELTDNDPLTVAD